jgi:hypothetical protein
VAVHVACDAICRLSQRLFSLSTLVTHMAMCLLTRCTLFTESQFPFESASGGDMAGRRQTESAGGGGEGVHGGPAMASTRTAMVALPSRATGRGRGQGGERQECRRRICTLEVEGAKEAVCEMRDACP